MAQGFLPFQYGVEDRVGGMTGLAGLPAYLEFAHVMGLGRMICDNVKAREGDQGWTDEQMVMSLVLLNLAGGDCVEDLLLLEGDEGLCRILREVEDWGRTGSEKRALRRRWRKKRMRTMPSPTAMRGYLEQFHDEEQEKLRLPHTAFIPAAKGALEGLVRANADFVAGVQRRTQEKTATLDMDATLVETHKREALYCYKKYKAYQPLNIYWAEQGLVVLSEFRDGNVSANFDLLRPFKRALELVPGGVEKVCLRSDAAGYRYLAIGEPLEQQTLPGMDGQLNLPFQTMNWGTVKCKVTGVVTNRTASGEEVIRWYRGRCGKSEEAHSVMKEDLAGGKLPSGLFGANAAWWQIMILAFNLNVAMKRLVLGESG